MYMAGTYGVSVTFRDGNYHCIRYDFETEQEAMDCANNQWKRNEVYEVEVFKRSYYKKRRKSICIAKHHK